MTKLLLSSLLVITASFMVHAKAQAKVDAQNCDDATSTAEINECIQNEYDAADKELNQVYKTIVASLKKDIKTGDEFEKKDAKETLIRLITSQRTWIKYRLENCSLESIQMLGGSGEGTINGGCQVRMTKEKTQQLKEIFSNLFPTK